MPYFSPSASLLFVLVWGCHVLLFLSCFVCVVLVYFHRLLLFSFVFVCQVLSCFALFVFFFFSLFVLLCLHWCDGWHWFQVLEVPPLWMIHSFGAPGHMSRPCRCCCDDCCGRVALLRSACARSWLSPPHCRTSAHARLMVASSRHDSWHGASLHFAHALYGRCLLG